MKKTLTLVSVLLCTVMLFSVIAVPSSAVTVENSSPNYADRYTDVPKDSWYYSAVSEVHLLMYGSIYSGRCFFPERDITREEFVTVLYRLDEKARLMPHFIKHNDDMKFTDVKLNTWYSDAILWAWDIEISEGVSADHFGLGRSITREEAVTLLMRYLDRSTHLIYTGEASTPLDPKDGDDISVWAKEYADAALDLGIIVGTDDGRFEPSKNITRAETAQIFARLWKYLDYDFGYVFSTENADELCFFRPGEGNFYYEYKADTEEKQNEILNELSMLQPTGATEDNSMEFTGGAFTEICYRHIDINLLPRSIYILSENTLIVEGFKIYTFNDPCFKEYLDLLVKYDVEITDQIPALWDNAE